MRRVDEEGARPEQGQPYLSRLTTAGLASYWSVWPAETVLSVLGDLDGARWALQGGEGR